MPIKFWKYCLGLGGFCPSVSLHVRSQHTDMPQSTDSRDTSQRTIDVAIVGGGLAGLAMAIGLTKRHPMLNVKVYERAQNFDEFGAGIGFPPNGEAAMSAIDARIHAIYKTISTPNPSPWLLYVDGMHDAHRPISQAIDSEEPLLFKMTPGQGTFQGCARSQMVEGMLSMLPDGVVVMGKSLLEIVDRGVKRRLSLRFADMTSAEAEIGEPIHPGCAEISRSQSCMASEEMGAYINMNFG